MQLMTTATFYRCPRPKRRWRVSRGGVKQMLLVWPVQCEGSVWLEHRAVENVEAAVEVMLEKGVYAHLCLLFRGEDVVPEEEYQALFDVAYQEMWWVRGEEAERREYERLKAKFDA